MWAGGFKLTEEQCIAILLSWLMGEKPPEEMVMKAVRTVILLWLEKHDRPHV